MALLYFMSVGDKKLSITNLLGAAYDNKNRFSLSKRIGLCFIF